MKLRVVIPDSVEYTGENPVYSLFTDWGETIRVYRRDLHHRVSLREDVYR